MAEVLQCDRDAAAALIEAQYARNGIDSGRLQTPNETRMGDRDHCPEVQAFAAHREAAEKASDQAVVDWLRDAVPYDFDVEGGMYFRMIAKALAQSIERDDHRKGPVQ